MGKIDYKNYIEEKLKRGGYKLTSQRLDILNVMYKSGRHMSADEIYSEVKDKKTGLTTVYRNLMIFEEIGLVTKISITNINYYELVTMDEYKVHIHAKCGKCNKIIDINEVNATEEYLNFVEQFKKKFKFSVESINIVASELCEGCDSKLKVGM